MRAVQHLKHLADAAHVSSVVLVHIGRGDCRRGEGLFLPGRTGGEEEALQDGISTPAAALTRKQEPGGERVTEETWLVAGRNSF